MGEQALKTEQFPRTEGFNLGSSPPFCQPRQRENPSRLISKESSLALFPPKTAYLSLHGNCYLSLVACNISSDIAHVIPQRSNKLPHYVYLYIKYVSYICLMYVYIIKKFLRNCLVTQQFQTSGLKP